MVESFVILHLKFIFLSMRCTLLYNVLHDPDIYWPERQMQDQLILHFDHSFSKMLNLTE